MIRRSISLLILLGFFSMTWILEGYGQGKINVLMLSKSSGFEHGVIKREDNELGYAEKIMLELGQENNFNVVTTKDAGMIHPEQLKYFDVVMFYTTGDISETGNDKNPPMNPKHRKVLIEWVQNGGGFFGSHTASDTFHGWEPYLKLAGGEFASHGKQEEAELLVKDHDITSHLDDSFLLKDEYYIFKNVTGSGTPLLILNTKSMKQDVYTQLEPYPITWIDELGKGRIFNCALGHRKDVWSHPDYQKLIVKGIQWAAGK